MSATKDWVDHWRRVGPLLEKVRHEELRAMTDEDAARIFRVLADYMDDVPRREPRTGSELVEAAREINDFLARQEWQYCVVGGIALSRVG